MSLSALTQRDFRWFLCGNAFTLNGIWMQRITIGWLAWDTSGSSAVVGLLGFLNFAPMIFAGPFLGAMSDRNDPKRMAQAAQFAFTGLSGIMLVLLLTDTLSLGWLTLFSVLLGTANAAYNPSRIPLALALTRKSDLESIVSLSSLNLNLARMTGPALGGAVVAQWGIDTAFVVQLLLYLPHLVVLARVSPRPPEPALNADVGLLSSVLASLALALRLPDIRHAMILSGSYGLVVRGSLEILPVIADGIFQKGAAGLGLLAAAAGGGAMAGGMVQSLLPAGWLHGRSVSMTLSGTLISFLMLPVMGFSTIWGLTIGAVVIIGFMSSTTAISLVTEINLAIEDGMRGRMNSLWLLITFGGSAVGALTIGLAVQIAGTGPTFLIAGISGAALVLIAYLWNKRSS